MDTNSRMRSCCIPGCADKQVSRFSIPCDKRVRQVWLSRINNPKLKNVPEHGLRNYRVCAHHFDAMCFESESRNKILRFSAPTLKLINYTAASTRATCFAFPEGETATKVLNPQKLRETLIKLLHTSKPTTSEPHDRASLLEMQKRNNVIWLSGNSNKIVVARPSFSSRDPLDLGQPATPTRCLEAPQTFQPLFNTVETPDWNLEDKRKLLLCLQKHGADMFEVQKVLPHKTITEIRTMFEKYQRLGSPEQDKDEEEVTWDEDSAINQWIQILQQISTKTSGINDIIPRILKYIALYERRPMDPSVKLKECYMALSNVCNELYLPKMDGTTKYFFFEHLSRLAQQMTQPDCVRQRKLIKDIKIAAMLKNKPMIVKTYNRNKRKVNAILNPLNLPEKF